MATEQKVGTVIDYYGKIGVAAILLTDGELGVGDLIRVKGHTTDFTQTVDSLQIEHQAVERAGRGSQAAVKVRERARRHDEVLRVTEG
jgi:putative protease